MLLLLHHLVADHTTLELLIREGEWIEAGRQAELPEPVPSKLRRPGPPRRSPDKHEAFFREQLAGFDKPTAPFGLLEVHADSSAANVERLTLPSALAREIRSCARGIGVSPATVMHLAWALVLARVSDRRDVVFGTVLFGRMQGGLHADRVLGVFINTLPVRIRIESKDVPAASSRPMRCSRADSPRARPAGPRARLQRAAAANPALFGASQLQVCAGRGRGRRRSRSGRRDRGGRVAVVGGARELSPDVVGG